VKLWLLEWSEAAQARAMRVRYDVNLSFVIRARHVADARSFAQMQLADEASISPEFWQDPHWSTCTSLRGTVGPPGVIVASFNAG